MTSQCSPIESSGWSWASATASLTAGPVTIMLVLVKTPLVWASTIPRFTPVDAPKSSALTTRNRLFAVTSCHSDVVEQTADDLGPVEILVCEVPRRPAMTFVVAVDLIDGGYGLVRVGHREEPFALREHEGRVLGDDRLAGGQVFRIPFTEPTTAQA